jgi:hypothetical protein
MGVHLVFFLHITTGPESTNNVLALAFGVLIIFLDRRVALHHVVAEPQHAADEPGHVDAALAADRWRASARSSGDPGLPRRAQLALEGLARVLAEDRTVGGARH